MATVQVTSQVSLDLEQLIEGVAQLNTSELEQFVGQVSQLLAQRRSSNLSHTESELLQQINQGLSPSIQKRYDELRAKQIEDAITEAEYQELLQLVDRVEDAEAKRLEQLLSLANLRNVPLPELMKQLEIEAPSPNV